MNSKTMKLKTKDLIVAGAFAALLCSSTVFCRICDGICSYSLSNSPFC